VCQHELAKTKQKYKYIKNVCLLASSAKIQGNLVRIAVLLKSIPTYLTTYKGYKDKYMINSIKLVFLTTFKVF
jgi:hypothetical protein